MLEIVNVTKNFGGLTALNDIDLAVKEKQIYGLIGPNGAGKTTLFNIITGFLPPSEGSIQFSGKELTRLPPNKIARLGIARTFQNIRLFGTMTVMENVLVAQNIKAQSGILSLFQLLNAREKKLKEEAEVLLQKMGLWKKRNELSISLAYGDQRRLEIARALATEPIMLLLDEPAAGMNPQETIELDELISQIRDNGLAILLIEHDMKLVMNISDNIFVVDYGKKIAEGTPDEIAQNPDVIKAYLGEDVVNA